MKKSFLISCLAFKFLFAAGQDETSAYKYILDYQVPSSPAFTLLDVTPQQVTRASAAKPLLAHLFSNYLQTNKLDPGIALDFSPYLLLGGGFKNINDYQNNTGKRILANTLLSIASIKNSTDSNNLDFAIAGRITLFDSHDLFADKNSSITNDIGASLANAADARVINGQIPDDVVGTVDNPASTVPVDLTQIYNKAYNSLKSKGGVASSVGFGYKSTAKNSSLVLDSLINQEYKLWWSFTKYKIFKGADLLSIVQGTLGKEIIPEWKGGIAVASQNKTSNMGAEIVYNFETKDWEYGANFEIRLFKQLTYVIFLGKRSIEDNRTLVEKFRAISSFRLNLFSH